MHYSPTSISINILRYINELKTGRQKRMWSALFGAGELGVLVLRPTPSAQTHVSGFKSGTELKISADVVGQTVEQILDKLNKYRGPTQQIRRVWDPTTDREIPGSQVLQGQVQVLVKAESIMS